MLPTIGAYSRDSIDPSEGVPPLGAAKGVSHALAI